MGEGGGSWEHGRSDVTPKVVVPGLLRLPRKTEEFGEGQSTDTAEKERMVKTLCFAGGSLQNLKMLGQGVCCRNQEGWSFTPA